MKSILAIALAAGAALAAAAPADAAGGCGRGFHPGPHGRCWPNDRGPGFGGGRDVYVVDRFYPGRGYWDGHRWYQHRDRWHGGWRYR